MLARPSDRSDSSGRNEQQTAIVVAPVHDDGKNRMCFEYSQSLLETNRRNEPHGDKILRVSITGSTELRTNRSLEALCNAADSELKNIGHQVSCSEQQVQTTDFRYSNQVACVMNSAVGSSGKLMLPAIQLEPAVTGNSPSETVLLMPKPVTDSDISYPSVGLYVPVTSSAVSAGISISNSSVELDCPHPLTVSKKNMSQTLSLNTLQNDSVSGMKLSRHTCKFCGRVCAKPSVLQKHIRTHTGERPFPCTTCGLCFKTKSNLYKHCKSRTHLYALSGTDSLSTDEGVSSTNGKQVAEEEQTDDAVDNTIGSGNDGQQQQLKKAKSLSHLPLSPTVTDNKMTSDATSVGCKVLTMIDGNMYVMEQVTLPSWQPVMQQLQQAVAVSFNVPLQSTAVSENNNTQSQPSLPDFHSSMQIAVIPSSPSNFSATSVESRIVSPVSRSITTAEALQAHISRLISENASIINTPMAEAPRAKRVLRQSSDVTASAAAKPTVDRPLLRTRSLTPCPTAVPQTNENDVVSSGSVSSEAFRQKSLYRAASETAVYNAPQQLSRSFSSGRQFLTVPKEPHCIEDITNRAMLLPSKSTEDTAATDVQCSEVRIVLELADPLTSASAVASVDASKKSSLSHLPVLSTAVTAQPFSDIARMSSISSQPAECQNPTLLSAAGLVSTFCMVKPVEEATVSGSGLPVQYVQTNPMVQSVPLQCVILGRNEVTIPVTSHTSPVARTQNSKSVTIEVVSAQQQPRRGRPKGSKNRPKLAASASEPKGSVTARTVAVREPLSAGVMLVPSTDALWRHRLKDRLMQRSLSTERHASPTRQEHQPVLSSSAFSPSQNVSTLRSCCGTSAAGRGSQLLSTSSLCATLSAAVTAPPVIRSRSCDASVPPKKRRKTLTELGRGTAFGTRVEESASVFEAQSNEAAHSDSLSIADDSVFEPQPQNLSAFGTVSDTSSADLFPLTNRALQIMYNSPPRASAICSSAVMHGNETVGLPDSIKSQPLFIRLPTGIGSKIPGLVRCSSLTLESDSSVTVSPTFTVQNATTSSVCGGDNSKMLHCLDVCRNKNPVKVLARLVSIEDSQLATSAAAAVASSVAVTEKGQKTARSFAPLIDETALFELPSDVSASSGTLLLLGHSYPSLGIVAEPTFCSILSTQPACVETSGEANSRASTYNTWHVSDSEMAVTTDKLVLTARDTFSLYRTSRHGKDLSYAAAPAFNSRAGGLLTHSSYWKYRTDHNSSSCGEQVSANATSPAVDVGKKVDIEEATACANSSGSTEKNCMSPIVVVSNDLPSSPNENTTSEVGPRELEVASSRPAEGDVTHKRVWIFPGGYRSTESYVYVRGRGRGRYVCATCGVRCKKPSVLRKHLRSHTDVRPHHCHICDVGFKTKGNLSKHLNSKAHHSRSSELGSSIEQLESGKSMQGSSYDADLDSSCELAPSVDPESDSGCELQQSSSYEVETEAVSVQHHSSSVEADVEHHVVEKQTLLVSGLQSSIQSDASVSSKSHLKTSHSQSTDVSVFQHNQPLVIMPALQQRQALLSKLKTLILITGICQLCRKNSVLCGSTKLHTATTLTLTQ